MSSGGTELRPLVDFFNHGTLPFVGRRDQIDRIVAFWRATAESNALRMALVIGEAGVGKSRLLEELVPRIAAAGGVAVQAKLYPGSSTSLAPLLARALRFSGAGRHLLRKEPEENLPSVIASLQRLARLRPLLLVIEDIHLLEGDALAECALLLESIAGESVSVLALARPTELGARGLIERYLVEEIELEGLSLDDTGVLWERLFGVQGEPELLQATHRVTAGNALALRSALRGALKTGVLAREPNGWAPAVPLPRFAEALERNVRLLSEGMAAHLGPEEKEAAERLATLGELFSRETAQKMGGVSARMIDLLAFKGILGIASSSAAPVSGPVTFVPPLAFTHTLLHRHFVQSAPCDADALFGVIASGCTLYSVLPYQLLAESAETLRAEPEEILEVIGRLLESAVRLDLTPDWPLGYPVLAAAKRLFEAHAGSWDAATRDLTELALADTELTLMRRDEHTPALTRLIGRMLELTNDPGTSALRQRRIAALKYRERSLWRQEPAITAGVWCQVEELLEQEPDLRFTEQYIHYLESAAAITAAMPDNVMLRRIEGRLNEILAADAIGEELKWFARHSVARHFVQVFDTAEELEDRLRLLEELSARGDRNQISLLTLKLLLFETTGRSEALLEAVEEILPLLKEQGMHKVAAHYRLIYLCEGLWRGEAPEKVEEAIGRLIQESPPAGMARLRLGTGVRLCRIGTLLDNMEWTRHVMRRFVDAPGALSPHERVIMAIAGEAPREELEAILADAREYPGIMGLIRVLLGTPDADPAATEQEVRRVLDYPFLCKEDLLSVYAIADLLGRIQADPAIAPLAGALRSDIHQALAGALLWLEERSFHTMMRPLLAKYEPYFSTRELSGWRARLEAVAGRFRLADAAPRTGGRIGISMLGTIQVQRPGEEPVKLRGGRLRVLLGLLVANRMLEKSLSYREFCRLAASGEDDPERARKMTSMAILRLKESVGPELLDTEGDAPQLAMDAVRVDLLEAYRLLIDATRLARHGGLMRALPMVVEAFARIGGEVPFPSLYDDFFEAMREDFEFHMREAVLEVGGGLLREGDAPGAEEALRCGFGAMPGDEEITDLLCTALRMQGKRAEAGRIRLQAGEMEE